MTGDSNAVEQATGEVSLVKRHLADSLTLSRVVIGIIIISLSLAGEYAYRTVLILTLIGVITDMLDGRVARKYLGTEYESRIGKHDLTVDTFFVLSILAYFTLSGIVIPLPAGLGWISIAIASVIIWKFNPRVMILIEIPTILVLFAVAGVYDLQMFMLLIIPVTLLAVILNWQRVWHIIRVKIPSYFTIM